MEHHKTYNEAQMGWQALIHCAFGEVMKTFFKTNVKHWPDQQLINQIALESSKTSLNPERLNILLTEKNQWFYQFIEGYQLRQSFIKGGIDHSKKCFLQVLYNDFFKECSTSENRLLLNKVQIDNWNLKYSKESKSNQFSAFSKIATLLKPIDYWITDRLARLGLAILLDQTATYFKYDDYETFAMQLDMVWEKNKEFLLAYVGHRIPTDLLNDWNAPKNLKDFKLEIITRRFLDKILMLRSDKKHWFEKVQLNDYQIPIAFREL